MKSRFDKILKPAPAPNIPATMKLSEASRLTGIDRKTLIKYIEEGFLPGGRLGKLWIIPREDFTTAFSKLIKGNYKG